MGPASLVLFPRNAKQNVIFAIFLATHKFDKVNVRRMQRARRRVDNPARLDRGTPLIACTRLSSSPFSLHYMTLAVEVTFSDEMMEEGALALNSHIALVYLPNSLMSCIKIGCHSSPLYFHTLQHTL